MNRPLQHPARRERGVVLIFTLIILLILVISGVALVRSMHNSLFTAGNLAFRRDLVNQGEQAVSTVMTQFKTGVLATATAADLPAANYVSTTLPTNQQGVPTALLDDTAFAAVGTAGNDLTGATPDVTMRYVIDRMCSVTGPASTTTCVQSSAAPTGGTASANTSVPAPAATVYRLSVRVSGARSTQVFVQTTFTKQD